VSSAIQTQLDAKQATITGSATTIDTESLTASRAIVSNASQKIAVSDVTSTELGYLDGVSSAIQTQMDTKAATTYVDSAVAGLRTRIICEAASTADVTISSGLENGDTIDGVTLATGDQVLLKDQSSDSQNGIYTVVSSGTASRSTEYNTIDEISGQMVVVNQGSTNDNTIWLCTTDSSATLDSSSITFTKITPSNVGDVTLTGTQTLTNKTLTSPAIDGSGVVFEGATADAYETTLSPVDPTADHTQYLINQGGYIPVLSTVTTTAISATPTELNLMDGGTTAGTTAVASGDGIVTNDGGTMRQTTLATFDTYLSGSTKTLTNKTLTSPKINEDVACSATATELNLLDGCTSTTTELNYNDLTTLGTSAASKVLSADSNNLTKVTGGIYLEEDTLTFDATQDWDVRASPVAKVTLTANVTFDAPTNPTTGQFISIVCIQDGTGSRTIAWNTVFEFTGDEAPTATTTASQGDMFNFRYNGAKWLEVGRNLNLTLS